MDRVAWHAVLGGVLWATWAPFIAGPTPELAWVHRFVLLAALVGVPLAHRALRLPEAPFDQATLWLQPFAAAAALAGAVLAPGALAAWLAAPWLLFALLRATAGLYRILAAPRLDVGHGALALADLFLPVGAFWLLVAHGGGAFMGIEPPLPILTAVHFHYTTYTALVLAALVARGSGEHPTLGAAVILAAIGTPVTAAGITIAAYGDQQGNTLGLGGAILVVTAFVLLALRSLFVALTHRLPARWLLAASAVFGLSGVPLGVVWAYDQTGAGLGVTIDFMVRYHGAVNALGFVLPALLAWSIIRPPRPARLLGIRPARGPLVARAGTTRPLAPAPADAEHHVWTERLGAADDDVFQKARQELLSFRVGTDVLAHDVPGRVAPGQRIDQWARYGPLDFDAGLRVTDVDEGPDHVTVTVATLEGHPEAGTKSYELRRDANGITLTMRSTSGPATWLLRMMRGRVRRLQDDVNRRVLVGFRERVG